jgi:phage-related protein
LEGQGPGVFEAVEDDDGDTDRAVYTVRFQQVVYVPTERQILPKSGKSRYW